MKEKFSQLERGQSLVLIGLLMIAFVAMLALVVDGGFSYANRRAAQNAADAGALAGAQALCNSEGIAAAENLALTYAITNNHATSAEALVSGINVNVTAHVNYQTFFAGLLGFDVVTSTAQASAGCKEPCSAVVLPIAWTCDPPGANSDSQAGVVTGICDVDTSSLYIVMDSQKTCTVNSETVDCVCQDPVNTPNEPYTGAVDCDTDDDGFNDLSTGGNRSWIYLDPDSNEIRDFITGDEEAEINIPIWLQGNSGVMSDLTMLIGDLVDNDENEVVLPIYDAICSDYPPTTCPEVYSSTVDTLPPVTRQDTYYHIIDYSYFKITCVQKNNSVWYDDDADVRHVFPVYPPNDCPGRAAAFAANGLSLQTDSNIGTIEGLFMTGSDSSATGNCGPSDGEWLNTIYLNP